MTSHEYAKKLRELAMHLELAESFELPDYQENYHKGYGLVSFRYQDDKTGFLAAVKAVGAGKKQAISNDFIFSCFDGALRLSVQRNSVCRLVKPAEYECEPLLSRAEEGLLNG